MTNLKNNKVIYLIILFIIIFITLLFIDDNKESNENYIPTAIPTITPEPIINPTSNSENKPAIIPTIIVTPTIIKIEPTPVPPRSYVEEMGKLIYEKGISAETLFLKSVSINEWEDESLGCPKLGEYYSDNNKPYKGYKYILSDGKNEWEYHTDINDTYTVFCEEILKNNHKLININSELNLNEAEEIKLYRWNFDENEFLFLESLEEIDFLKVVDILKTDLILSEQESCRSLFMIEFSRQNQIDQLEFICSENKYALFGNQKFWNQMQAKAPKELGKIIGSYLTGQPIPSLPE
tara:strand:+ start:35833 stop:36714 length:882 start_codon:yes stop_codon:yes gene_type:complete